MFTTIVSILALVAIAHCHLCLINPTQRGTMKGINKEGADDCILLTSPCGGRKNTHSPQIALKSGSNYTVTWQKNLDHYSEATPGFFSVSIGVDDMESSFKEYARVADAGEPSLSLYSTTITLPEPSGHPHQIMQVTYTTNNKQAPAEFFQCADFMLY